VGEQPAHGTSPANVVDVDPPGVAVVDAVARALAEDLLPLGDLTAALVPSTTVAAVAIVSRASGVLAGRACAVETLRQIDPVLEVVWLIPDGGRVEPGERVAEISGPLRSILTAERTVLNFLGHLSGVASLTRRYVDAVEAANPATRVLDTRKTTPGLRALEKAAVRAGGGHNHRASLSDAVLVKDNHLAGLSIAEAVARAKDLWPGRMVEVECDHLSQVDEAVAAGATVIMLDNMSIERVAGCVSQLRADGVTTLVEVSGGVDLLAAPKLATAGADLISVGALTHSSPVLDLGFDLALPAEEGG
jgi:nicotinate-nucleotide pyrophosphorylase (carboxylating)